MSSTLITADVWKHLTRATKKAKGRGMAAVAYFGKGAAKLLPLRAGSTLVVDASEAAVKSGQTHPKDLLALVNQGVRVFSVRYLHAKLYVLGDAAYIGSANASRHSEKQLVEALLCTDDRKAVLATRRIIRDWCLNPLGPEQLAKLQRLFPKNRAWPGGGRSAKRRGERSLPELPPVRVVQLHYSEPPEGSESAQEEGARVAKKKLKQRQTHHLEDIWWRGRCPIGKRDLVVQVVDEGNGRTLVSPPSAVIHRCGWRRGKTKVTFLYLESANRKRIRVERLAKMIGYGARKQLRRNAIVKNPRLVKSLMRILNR